MYRHVYIQYKLFNRSRYEDELIERIVVPYTQHVDVDPDITIRTVTANLLIDLCLECDTKRCIELLDILEKVLEFSRVEMLVEYVRACVCMCVFIIR